MNYIKQILIVLSLIFVVGSCALFHPANPYQMGMSEGKFLRQNRDAEISQLDDTKKVYRITKDERFYILVTFENGELTYLEEKELTPVWPQQRMMNENESNNNPNP
ncbi:MAG: hypothetical protein WDZ72_14445 [Cyclobacteriaceae bacterium]